MKNDVDTQPGICDTSPMNASRTAVTPKKRHTTRLIYIRPKHAPLWAWFEKMVKRDSDSLSRRLAFLIHDYRARKMLERRNPDFRDPDLQQPAQKEND